MSGHSQSFSALLEWDVSRCVYSIVNQFNSNKCLRETSPLRASPQGSPKEAACLQLLYVIFVVSVEMLLAGPWPTHGSYRFFTSARTIHFLRTSFLGSMVKLFKALPFAYAAFQKAEVFHEPCRTGSKYFQSDAVSKRDLA